MLTSFCESAALTNNVLRLGAGSSDLTGGHQMRARRQAIAGSKRFCTIAGALHSIMAPHPLYDSSEQPSCTQRVLYRDRTWRKIKGQQE